MCGVGGGDFASGAAASEPLSEPTHIGYGYTLSGERRPMPSGIAPVGSVAVIVIQVKTETCRGNSKAKKKRGTRAVGRTLRTP